jgi:hypothetical protein
MFFSSSEKGGNDIWDRKEWGSGKVIRERERDVSFS